MAIAAIGRQQVLGCQQQHPNVFHARSITAIIAAENTSAVVRWEAGLGARRCFNMFAESVRWCGVGKIERNWDVAYRHTT
jgi:hypothetical protein